MLEILRVEPFEFGFVKNAVSAAYAFEFKFLNQVGGTEKFHVASRGPSEQREEILKGFGQKAFVAVHSDAGGAVAFGEALAVRSQNEGQMRENWRFGFECAVQQNLFGSIGKMIGAANDMRDAHVNVVDHHAELIHGLAEFFVTLAGAQQHEVFDIVVGEFGVAEDHVVESCFSADGDFEANRGLGSRRRRLSIAAAAAHHAANLAAFAAIFGVVAADIFFSGAVTEKSASVGEAFFCGGAVNFRALGLIKRAVIPIEAQPVQSAENAFDEFGLVAFGIRVLDAQNHGAVLLARKQPVK